MNRNRLLIGGLVLLGIAGICAAMYLHRGSGAPGDRPAHGGGGEREVLYWYDPMQPGQHFDKPGKSPFMDMQLMPKYADDGADEGGGTVVRVDPRMAQNLGVRTESVRSGRLRQRVDAVGSVSVDEKRIVAIEARASGWVERLDVRAIGEPVRRGQVVAGIYAPDLLAAQEELALARKLGDDKLVAAARQRLELLGVDATTVAAVPQRRVPVTAPLAGVVVELAVREGAQVTPGTPLMKLADLSSVWIVVEIPEAQAAWIAAGTPVEARLRGLPGKLVTGTVDFVYPMLDTATRTVRARIVIDNADGALKPGMYAEITITGADLENVALVPTEAVIRTGTRSVVLLAEALGRYRPVEVRLGPEQGDEIVVLAGLEAGQQVVVSGQFLIDSEASLLGAYNRMGAGDDRESQP